ELIDSDCRRSSNDLTNWFEDVTHVTGRSDERITILHTRDGITPEKSAIFVGTVGRSDEAVDLVDVTSKARRGGEYLTNAVYHLPPPVHLHYRAVGISVIASIICEGHGIAVKAEFATYDRIFRDIVIIDDWVNGRVRTRYGGTV